MDNTEMIILQESCVDKLEVSLIYGLVELWKVKSKIKRDDNIEITIMPSGFAISSDHSGIDDSGISLGSVSSSSRPSTSRSTRASLLTMALQVMVPSNKAIGAV